MASLCTVAVQHRHCNCQCHVVQGDVAADGSHPASVRRWQQQLSAEKELEAAEQAHKRKEKVRHAERAICLDIFQTVLDLSQGVSTQCLMVLKG